MNNAIKLAIEKGGYKYGYGIDGDYETDGWSYGSTEKFWKELIKPKGDLKE